MEPRGEYLQNYRRADRFQKLNTSTKALYFTRLSDGLIMKVNIFKYSSGIIRKIVSNLIIDKEISRWGNRMVLSRVIYHKKDLR